MIDNDNFDLDKELDNTFDTDNDSDIQNDNNFFGDEDNGKDSEELESLEALINDSKEEKETKSDKNDTKINTNEQIEEQNANKSKRTPNSGDVVDANGNIIAKAGAERRFYEENVKLKREKEDFNYRILPTIRQNYDAMVAKVNSYEQAFQAMKMTDLSPEDVNLGVELIRQWKADPEKTLKFLLTQGKSYGINLDNEANSINMQAINQMLDEKLRPFVQEREMKQQEIARTNEVRKTYNDFMSKYPDAKNHTKELAYLVRQNPDMPLESIYYKLRSHYAEKGYDFSTPLEEILKQKQQTNSNFGSINTNQNINMKPINKVASVNRSYEDIIKEALKSNKI